MITEAVLANSLHLLLATLGLLLAGALAFRVSGHTLAFVWPSLRQLLAQSTPRYHTASLLLFGVTPAVATTVALLSAVAVSQSAGFNLLADHCHQGSDGFSCAPHLPAGSINFTLPALALLSALLMLGLTLLPALRGHEHRRLSRNLGLCSRFDGALDAIIVPSDRPFAFCLGLFVRRIYVSQALIDSLTEAELEIVLDHERNHARRAHSAVLLFFGALSSAFPTRIRSELTGALRLVLEHQSDRFAAIRCGDHLAVADLLIKLRRLQIDSSAHGHPRTPELALSIEGGALHKRIAWMIDPAAACERRVATLAGRVLCCGVISALMAGEAAHIALELLIDRLAA